MVCLLLFVVYVFVIHLCIGLVSLSLDNHNRNGDAHNDINNLIISITNEIIIIIMIVLLYS